ncbi:hypothetical protein KEM52_005885 [Ascosphaera acerosa]|nr:hypothetical protein KEM52_005885 [Ascosphaera acerosa]
MTEPPRIARGTQEPATVVKARKRADQALWRESLALLLELSALRHRVTGCVSRTAELEGQERLRIPETTIVQLLGDLGENKIYLENMNGCMIHVLDRGPDFDGVLRDVVLRGTPVSRNIARRMLQEAVDGTGLRGDATAITSVPKVTFAFDATQRHKSAIQRADTLKPPDQWTWKSLSWYVDAVTSIPMPHSAHRTLYKHGERHTHVVRNILYHLVNDAKTAGLLSTRAINVVISYLDKNGALPQLWAMYPRLEPFMTTRSFNTLLSHAAHKGDLRLFNSILRKMEKAEVPPNGLTWCCLLQAARARDARIAIFGHMWRLGLLETPHYLQSAIPIVISKDFYQCRRSGLSVAEFMSFVDGRLGTRSWFTEHAARELVYVAVMFRDGDAIQAILRCCDEVGVTPDVWTLEQILRYYTATRDFVGGARLYIHAYKRWELDASPQTLDFLFALAWACQAPNTCRLIWWYACLRKGASWSMRSRISKSLHSEGTVASGDAPAASEQSKWETYAGKLIAGIDLKDVARRLTMREDMSDITAFLQQGGSDRALKQHPTRILDRVNAWHPATAELRLQRAKLAHLIVRSDLDAASTWDMQGSFIRLLTDAANVDVDAGFVRPHTSDEGKGGKSPRDVAGLVAGVFAEAMMHIPMTRRPRPPVKARARRPSQHSHG